MVSFKGEQRITYDTPLSSSPLHSSPLLHFYPALCLQSICRWRGWPHQSRHEPAGPIPEHTKTLQPSLSHSPSLTHSVFSCVCSLSCFLFSPLGILVSPSLRSFFPSFPHSPAVSILAWVIDFCKGWLRLPPSLFFSLALKLPLLSSPAFLAFSLISFAESPTFFFLFFVFNPTFHPSPSRSGRLNLRLKLGVHLYVWSFVSHSSSTLTWPGQSALMSVKQHSVGHMVHLSEISLAYKSKFIHKVVTPTLQRACVQSLKKTLHSLQQLFFSFYIILNPFSLLSRAANKLNIQNKTQINVQNKEKKVCIQASAKWATTCTK